MKSTSKDTAREVLKELGISEPTKVQIDLLQNVLLDAYFEGKQEGFRWGTKLDEEQQRQAVTPTPKKAEPNAVTIPR